MLTVFLIGALVAVVIIAFALFAVATFLSLLITNLRLGIDHAVNWIGVRRNSRLDRRRINQLKAQEPSRLAPPPKSMPIHIDAFGRPRTRRAQPLDPVRITIKRPTKQINFAIAAPTERFALLCECPHCGKWDTHHLRVPVRPAPPDPPPPADLDTAEQQEKAWWESVRNWFADEEDRAPRRTNGSPGSTISKSSEPPWWDVTSWFTESKPEQSVSETETDPTNDHVSADAVRICQSCEHVWAQL
jgi:hypothetical protein